MRILVQHSTASFRPASLSFRYSRQPCMYVQNCKIFISIFQLLFQSNLFVISPVLVLQTFNSILLVIGLALNQGLIRFWRLGRKFYTQHHVHNFYTQKHWLRIKMRPKQEFIQSQDILQFKLELVRFEQFHILFTSTVIFD